jgi:GT2 family glycosyltransferase
MKAVHEEKELEENYFHSDFISGCAVLIRAEVFKKIGLLDEDYFLYWEDADFSLKAKRAGYRLLISPKSKIFHLEISEKKKAAKIYWLVVSGLIFFQKNSPLWLRPYIFIYILLRKIKNYFDFRFRYSKTAEMVRQAYKDFAKYV